MRAQPDRMAALLMVEAFLVATIAWSLPAGIGCGIGVGAAAAFNRTLAWLMCIGAGLGWGWAAWDLGGWEWGVSIGAVGLLLNAAAAKAMHP